MLYAFLILLFPAFHYNLYKNHTSIIINNNNGQLIKSSSILRVIIYHNIVKIVIKHTHVITLNIYAWVY